MGISGGPVSVDCDKHVVCVDAESAIDDWLYAQEYVVGDLVPRKQFSDSLHILSCIHFY
jgi:hypothetical protein